MHLFGTRPMVSSYEASTRAAEAREERRLTLADIERRRRDADRAARAATERVLRWILVPHETSRARPQYERDCLDEAIASSLARDVRAEYDAASASP